MKILFAIDYFPPITYNSVSTLTYNLAKGLSEKGHEVFVVTSVQDKLKQGEEKYEGLGVFRIYSKYHKRWGAYLSLYNPEVVRRFNKIIKDIKPDVVHFQNIHQYLSYSCIKIARKYARGVFLTAHDTMLFYYGKLLPKNGHCTYRASVLDQIKQAGKGYNPFRNLIIRHCLKYTDQIFAVSNSLKEVLKINGINNVKTIYNGINVNEWEYNETEIGKFKTKYNLQNKKVVLFGGRLSGAKGGEVILRAMALVLKSIKGVVLLVAGERDWYAEKMVKLSKELRIEDNVIFTNEWLDRETMKCAFFACDICTTPSIYLDPFNLFNIEAAAARKPVVGTCFGGTSEIIIDGKTGYIVNPLNTDKLAEKIIDLLKNPPKAKQFGEAGHERVKNYFSFSEQLEETLKYYLQSVNIAD